MFFRDGAIAKMPYGSHSAIPVMPCRKSKFPQLFRAVSKALNFHLLPSWPTVKAIQNVMNITFFITFLFREQTLQLKVSLTLGPWGPFSPEGPGKPWKTDKSEHANQTHSSHLCLGTMWWNKINNSNISKFLPLDWSIKCKLYVGKINKTMKYNFNWSI